MKKKILMALSLVSVALLSIGGTVAFLSDKETSASTYSAGNVDIVLNNANGKTGEIRLVPGVDEYLNTSVTNQGEEDAYVWVKVAIPTTLDQKTNAYDNLLHWNPNGKYLDVTYENPKYDVEGEADVTYDQTWRYPVEYNADGSIKEDAAGNWVYVFDVEEIDGVEYNVYTFLYNGVLEAGESTGELLKKTYLDARIDYVEADDHDGEYAGWAFVKNGVVTPLNHDFSKSSSLIIKAYAMQVEGFADVEAAYSEFENQW